eukprot:1157543-Pelagomonas_calceolata.AAC.11
MLMKFMSTGAAPGAWMGATDQLLSAAKHKKIVLQACLPHWKPPKLGIPDKPFAWSCMPRALGRTVGCQTQAKDSPPKHSNTFPQHQPLPPTAP